MPGETVVFDDLVRVETVLWNTVDARLRAQCDLTLARFEAMQVIGRCGSCRVLDIARALAIGGAGASKIVDRVEAAGHCRRAPNPDDARSSLICLTPAGREVLGRADACVAAALRAQFGAALTPPQLTELGRLLSRLRATVHRHG